MRKLQPRGLDLIEQLPDEPPVAREPREKSRPYEFGLRPSVSEQLDELIALYTEGADPKGEKLAIGRRNRIEVWGTDPFEVQRVFRDGHVGGPEALRFSDDGQTLYSKGRDTVIVAWNVD